MKKILAVLLCICAVFLTSCGSSSNPSVKIEDGAYVMTPENYISSLNQVVEDVGDSRYLKIPEYLGSDESIEIDSIHCTLEITESENGNIANISYFWNGERKDIGYSVGLYFNATFDYFSGGEQEEIFNKLDIMNLSTDQYETTCKNNGTLYSYKKMGPYNWLTISPYEE